MEKLRKWGSSSCDQRDSWESTNLSFEKDRAYGFSWPQRNYSCSFCKKEFKSAQALGGHMNVHRRDRARMRLSPSSWDSHVLNPSPSLAASSPSSSAWLLSSAPSSKFSPYSYNSSPAASFLKEVKLKVPNGMEHRYDFWNLDAENGLENKKNSVWKAKEFVRLDLNMGLRRDGKEELDLELRLGC